MVCAEDWEWTLADLLVITDEDFLYECCELKKEAELKETDLHRSFN